MRSAKEAVAYLKKVHTLVRYLEICDGNMQEGSFRCDANVSVRKVGAEKFGTRAEIKNINSFRYVEKAINYEVARQIDVLEGGGKVVQETRLYDPDKGETRSMRSQGRSERLSLLPGSGPAARGDRRRVHREREGHAARAAGPEGRAVRRAVRPVGIRRRRAHLVEGAGGVLRRSRQTTRGRQGTFQGAGEARRQLGGRFAGRRAQRAQSRDRREPHRCRSALPDLLGRIADNTISGKIAKDVFEAMWAEGKDADAIIESKGLKQITDTGAIEKAIDEVMAKNPGQLADYRSGKDKLFGFFVGQVMKATGGKANPGAAQRASEEEVGRLKVRLVSCMSPISSGASSSSGIRSAATQCACRTPGWTCANTRTIRPPCSSCWARPWAPWCCSRPR